MYCLVGIQQRTRNHVTKDTERSSPQRPRYSTKKKYFDLLKAHAFPACLPRTMKQLSLCSYHSAPCDPPSEIGVASDTYEVPNNKMFRPTWSQEIRSLTIHYRRAQLSYEASMLKLCLDTTASIIASLNAAHNQSCNPNQTLKARLKASLRKRLETRLACRSIFLRYKLRQWLK
jgi:hypothetical protein